MTLAIPKLRTWHLLGIVATSAAFIAVMQFRWSVEDPGYDLVRRLRSINLADRIEAAGRVGGYRPRERRAVAPLMELLYDADPRARGMAARALAQLVSDSKDEAETGPVKAALASLLRDPDPEARRAVAISLTWFNPEAKVVVPTLLDGLRRGDAGARSELVSALGPFARADEAARLALFNALGDPDANVRWQAVHALGSSSQYPGLAPQPMLGQAMTALAGAADDESPLVRSAAMYALGTVGGWMKVEVPRTIEALGDPDANVRRQAIQHLPSGPPGTRSEALLSALIRALGDEDATVRQWAARLLGSLEGEAEAALPALRALTSDGDGDVRKVAIQAVEAIEKAIRDDRAGIAAKLAELADPDPDVRALAADWLAGLGPRAAKAVPALLRGLGDPDPGVRRSFAEALGKIGPDVKVAEPDLAKLLAKLAASDPDAKVRDAARSALTPSSLPR